MRRPCRCGDHLQWQRGGIPRDTALPERIRAGVSLRGQVQFDTYLAQRRQTPSLSFRDHLRAVGGAIAE
jgi:hypothetical protein